jgi:hypothetical protein
MLPLFRDNPEITDILGKKARQRVLERYTLRNNITSVEQLYAEVLREKRVQIHLTSSIKT